MACAPSEESDQPGHPPSLIRVFAIRLKKTWILSYPLSAQRRLWSDWADAPIWVFVGRTCHFVGFATMRLNYPSEKFSDLSTLFIANDLHISVALRNHTLKAKCFALFLHSFYQHMLHLISSHFRYLWLKTSSLTMTYRF